MTFLFPGQSSQFVGMGKDLYDNFPYIRELFEEVSDAIHFNITKVIFNGPEEELNNTENTQPAIMAVSIAVVKALEKECGKKLKDIGRYVMGHSLGEYSALCAAGTLSVTDTAKLLKLRGQSMQNAMPIGQGTMLALLGVEMSQAEDIVKKVKDCEIANDNGGGQIVLSCLTKRVDEVGIVAKNIGIRKVIPLKVSAAFHSTFMQPAADKMQEAIENVKFSSPELPIISNVTASTITKVDDIKKALIAQMVQRVRWRESMLYCNRQRIKEYVELGPGNTLTNLVKRTLKEQVSLFNICDVKQLKDFISHMANRG